jgi:hypothetical protein
MQDSNTAIYISGLKTYKAKKLFYSKHFRALYRGEDSELSLIQYEYKLCTHMWLQRMREEDIVAVMGWWYARHHVNGNWGRLRRQIIPDTYRFTRAVLKQQRHAEYLRAKQRRLKKEGERRAA